MVRTRRVKKPLPSRVCEQAVTRSADVPVREERAVHPCRDYLFNL